MRGGRRPPEPVDPEATPVPARPGSASRRELLRRRFDPPSAGDCALSLALGLIPVSVLEGAKLARRFLGREPLP